MGRHSPAQDRCVLPAHAWPWILGEAPWGPMVPPGRHFPNFCRTLRQGHLRKALLHLLGQPGPRWGLRGGDPSIPPRDVGMWLSISSPGPTGWSLLAPGQQSTSVCFNCKDRSNPADFLGAAHTFKDWWIWK